MRSNFWKKERRFFLPLKAGNLMIQRSILRYIKEKAYYQPPFYYIFDNDHTNIAKVGFEHLKNPDLV